jgi:hypothetical protein
MYNFITLASIFALLLKIQHINMMQVPYFTAHWLGPIIGLCDYHLTRTTCSKKLPRKSRETSTQLS